MVTELTPRYPSQYAAIYRTPISSARPWTRGRPAARFKWLSLEDLTTKVVQILQRGSVEVDPARQRQPCPHRIVSLRGVIQVRFQRHG